MAIISYLYLLLYRIQNGCSTICNTRKYHGLLVIPVPNLDDENHVLLSSLDETVIQHGAEFNLGLHKYQGNNFSPNGHKYIREFDCEHIPATTYRVGGVILRKEKIFVHHENRILIRYTLLDAHSATTLRFRPFLAFRSVREYTHENAQASREYQLVENGIRTCIVRSATSASNVCFSLRGDISEVPAENTILSPFFISTSK